MHVKTKVEITDHAKVRMAQRKWTNENVLAAIEARDPHVVTETVIRVVSVLPTKISKKQARQQPEVANVVEVWPTNVIKVWPASI